MDRPRLPSASLESRPCAELRVRVLSAARILNAVEIRAVDNFHLPEFSGSCLQRSRDKPPSSISSGVKRRSLRENRSDNLKFFGHVLNEKGETIEK